MIPANTFPSWKMQDGITLVLEFDCKAILRVRTERSGSGDNEVGQCGLPPHVREFTWSWLQFTKSDVLKANDVRQGCIAWVPSLAHGFVLRGCNSHGQILQIWLMLL